MRKIKVAYLSKKSRDAVRDVDESLLSNIKTEHLHVDMINMPYIYTDNNLLSLIITSFLGVVMFFRVFYIYLTHDLVHCSSTTNYFWYYNLFFNKIFKNTRSVITVHHVTLSSKKILIDLYRKSLASYTGIVTISQSTRSDVLNIDNRFGNCLYVIPNGISNDFYPSPNISENNSYILYVGDEYKRKNLITALKAYKELLHDYPLIKFYKYGRVKSIHDRNFTDSLIKELGLSATSIDLHRDEVSRETLRNLYSNAQFLISPSLLEGFGLPVLEAARCGCIPLVSSIKVYKDYNFPDCCYVECPTDMKSWLEKMKAILAFGKRERSVIVKEVEGVSQEYSWEKSGARLSQVYNSLCLSKV